MQLPAQLSGVVTPYKGNGRKLGYPTANIATATQLADGVYFGKASLGDFIDHPAIIFIGTPTTVGDTERRVEAHILDAPDIDYYGQLLHLTLMVYYRGNQTFASVDLLVETMKQDEAAAREWASAKNSPPLAKSRKNLHN